MSFGQLVIGPPGSGKTTYCLGMHEFLTSLERKPVVVNLDFANDSLPYECGVNVCDYMSVMQVMEAQGLGPNGSLIYCMEQLDKNFEWLESRLKALDQDSYFIFDCPGQVEIFICHPAFRSILTKLFKMHFRLVSINLIDSFYLTDPSKFLSALIVSMQSMLHLECPHLNVFTKIDNLRNYNELAYELEEYAEPTDLAFLTGLLDLSPFSQKHDRLSRVLADLIEEYGLLSFIPFAVEDKECMAHMMREADKANGHVFGSLSSGNESIMGAAVSSQGLDAYVKRMQKRYVSIRNEPEGCDEDEEQYDNDELEMPSK